MRKKLASNLLSMVVLLGMWLALAPSVSAGYENIGGDLPYTGAWINYTTPRSVTYDPWGIAFKGYSGPYDMQISHYQCLNPDNTSVYEPTVLYQTWVYTRPNGASPWPIRFCMRAKKNVGIHTTFNGDLSWDGGY